MTETKKTYTDADFAAFDEEKLDKELDLIAADHPKYLVTERTFVGRLGTGEIVKIPLVMKLKDFEDIPDETDDPLAQLKMLLTRFGGEDEADKIMGAALTDAIYLSGKYFEILQKMTEKVVGK